MDKVDIRRDGGYVRGDGIQLIGEGGGRADGGGGGGRKI